MKKIIYTVITGGCDILKDPLVKLPGWDLVCFTDNEKLKSEAWEIRIIKDETLTSAKLSRKVKILAHQYLPDHDLSLYIDSYILIAKNIEPFIKEVLNYDHRGFIVKKHYCRNNIYQEAARIIETNRDDKETVLRQISLYRSLGFDYDILFENGIMIRKHFEPDVIEFCTAWWNEIRTHSYRDQLSLPYVAWKLKFKIGFFTTEKANQCFYVLPKKQPRIIKNSHIKIHEGTPYGSNLQYGKALNEFCSQAPEGSWIIIRDRDTMYLADNGKQIIDIAATYPDTGVFGCMTNRIGLNWQRVDGMFDEQDILKHYQKADELKKMHYDEVCNYKLPVAGFFMMFKKTTWNLANFREGNIVGENGIYFDWDFCQRVQSLNMPIRVMQGVYLFHFYRFNKATHRDVSHIMIEN